MAEIPLPLTAVILAGGQSRRLGTDKALLRFQGRTLLAASVERLRPLCQEIIVVTNTPQAHAHPAARLVGDLFPGKGALGGVYSGLMAAHTSHSLVIACDMPFVDEALVRHIIAQTGFDIVVPQIDGAFHPLFGLYSRDCLAVIEETLKQINNEFETMERNAYNYTLYLKEEAERQKQQTTATAA